MYFMLYKMAKLLARGMALLAGIVLIVVVVVTCASIIGRVMVPLNIGIGPFKGIYDFTEIAMAAAVFGFLPWCQINRGHATVDLFAPMYPRRMNQVIDLLVDVGMFAVATIGAWRLYLGMLDKLSYGETTLILQAPVWIGYLCSLFGAVAFAIVAAFCVLRSARVIFGLQAEEGAHV